MRLRYGTERLVFKGAFFMLAHSLIIYAFRAYKLMQCFSDNERNPNIQQFKKATVHAEFRRRVRVFFFATMNRIYNNYF